MLDRNLLVDDFEETKRRLMRKRVAEADIVHAREVIISRRKVASSVDNLKAKLNKDSGEIGQLLKQGKKSEAESLKASIATLKAELGATEAELEKLELACDTALMTLPNIPDDRVPDGKSEEANQPLRFENYDEARLKAMHVPPHWEIAESLGILDTKRAAKMSGSMFAILRGDGARLLRALVQLGLDLNRERYEEMIVPHIVLSETLMGTGHLPKFADDAFRIPADDLWLVPTGEVPLTAFHNNEILSFDELPIRYMTYTACFRREAGSAGKDTRGLQRLHEFHKLELVHIVAPEQGDEAFESLLADAERPLKLMGLPYRILDLCSGDLGFSAARMHDIEVYAPGAKVWLECSSVGLFSDFQARRSKMRFRRNAQSKPEILYTLNGSGLATPRVLAALLEHGYQPDGSVKLPEVLHDYMGKGVLKRP